MQQKISRRPSSWQSFCSDVHLLFTSLPAFCAIRREIRLTRQEKEVESLADKMHSLTSRIVTGSILLNHEKTELTELLGSRIRERRIPQAFHQQYKIAQTTCRKLLLQHLDFLTATTTLCQNTDIRNLRIAIILDLLRQTENEFVIKHIARCLRKIQGPECLFTKFEDLFLHKKPVAKAGRKEKEVLRHINDMRSLTRQAIDGKYFLYEQQSLLKKLLSTRFREDKIPFDFRKQFKLAQIQCRDLLLEQLEYLTTAISCDTRTSPRGGQKEFLLEMFEGCINKKYIRKLARVCNNRYSPDWMANRFEELFPDYDLSQL